MLRSLCLKLGLLIGTVGVILGLRWSDFSPVSQPKDDAEPITLTSVNTQDGGDQIPKREQPVARLDLNHSTAKELETLPGIGPVLAQRIVDRRVQQGQFRSLQELLKVQGIGPKKLQAVRPLVTVSFERKEKG